MNETEIYQYFEKRKWQLRADTLIEDGFIVEIGKSANGEYLLKNLGMRGAADGKDDCGYAE